MSVRIQLRRDTAANWASTNPTLTQGEPGLETDTGRVKYGNGSTAWNSLGYAALLPTGGAISGDITLNAQSDLRFADADSSNWVALQAPATITSNVTWTLPATDGTNNQVLKTNGSGTLSWTTPTSGGVSLGLVIALS